MPKKTQENKKKPKWTQQKYLFVLRNEENLQENLPFRGKGWQFLLIASLLLSLIVVMSMLLSVSVYVYWQENHSKEAQFLKTAFKLSYLTDSLQKELLYHQRYIRGLHAVFKGDPQYLDEAIFYENATDTSFTFVPFTQHSEPISSATSLNTKTQPLFTALASPDRTLYEDIYLFPPIKGYISDQYAFSESHYGIDLLAPKGSTVQATAAGVVMLASWTRNGGYVIAIQHDQGMVSFYKHNAALLKTVGQEVYAGDPIAIIGNTGTLSTGPHLHFEIWQYGKPLDPEHFINFQ